MSSTMRGKTIKRANTSTIQDKFMVGYQGWFTCPGDGPPIYEGHHGWLHWLSEPIPNGGRINTDLWPDFSEYSPSELYPVPGLKYPSGEQAFVFSSRNPKTVQRHFHWMATHGVDGAFLQRFLGQCDVTAGNEGIRNERDEIGDYVRDAAEKEGRAFAIMYDVSGVAPDRMQAVFEQDWVHLIREKAVLDSPNYLREKGKPVVVIWGFGFADRNHTPESVRAITNFIRNVTPGGVYLMAGVPAHWRTSTSDADPNPEFLDIWLNEFDALSPWTIGRYGNEEDADRFAEEKIKGDIELIQRRNEEGGHKHIDYIPVVLPGGSGYNTSQGQWGFNDIKRNGGRFLWKQIYNARRLGVRTIYGAMWDEYDEGTAYLPVVSHKSSLPILDNVRFMALDEDGHDLPPDWYMRITGYAAEVLRGERMIHETFPVKELKDFWSSRPKYEEENHHMAGVSGSASGFGGGQGQSYQEWLSAQRDDRDELPPPPYSLEVGAPEVPAATRPAESSPRPPVVDTSSRPPVATGAHIQVPAPPSPPPVPSRSSSATVSSITQDFI
ncbi:hypothetical protein PLICRDRAFT_285092 [Plicaturopsis crispa FD-325 SS-3]|nr:hypothetical protein PLICRDRAFT_285092 [Plicaturopsis crispa FD-325 SS-3]